MFCAKCGTQLPEGALVCSQCGEKVEKEINFSDVTSYASQKAQQVSAGIQEQVQNIRQKQEENKTSRAAGSIHEMFIQEGEQQKAVIGGGYLSNMIQSGTLGKGFGVLTDRRIYYRGKCFRKMGGHYVTTDEDCIVDLQDIASSGFTYTRYLWLLILALVSFLLCMASYIVYMIPRDAGSIAGVIGILFLAAFFFFKQSVYEVTFAGGSLSIKTSAYGLPEVKAFDKAVHLAKDELLERMR